MPTLYKENRTVIQQPERLVLPRVQPPTYYVRFKLGGHWIFEPFIMPLDYIMGLNPHSVRGEMGEVYVWNHKLTKLGRR